MSLKTDIIFVRALRSNDELMEQLPAGDVYNTTIAMPEQDAENAPLPYIIVTYDGMQNLDTDKDSLFEGDTDRVQIGIEVASESRPQLASLAEQIRTTVREFFENLDSSDEDYDLVPIDVDFSAQAVQYDEWKPCYWQVLQYQCDTNPD